MYRRLLFSGIKTESKISFHRHFNKKKKLPKEGTQPLFLLFLTPIFVSSISFGRVYILPYQEKILSLPNSVIDRTKSFFFFCVRCIRWSAILNSHSPSSDIIACAPNKNVIFAFSAFAFNLVPIARLSGIRLPFLNRLARKFMRRTTKRGKCQKQISETREQQREN